MGNTVTIETEVYRRQLRQIEYFVFYLRHYGDAEVIHHMAELDGFEVVGDRCNNPDCVLCAAEKDIPNARELLGEPVELPETPDPEIAQILGDDDQEYEEDLQEGVGEPVQLDGLPVIEAEPMGVPVNGVCLLTWDPRSTLPAATPKPVYAVNTTKAQTAFLFPADEAPSSGYYLGECL